MLCRSSCASWVQIGPCFGRLSVSAGVLYARCPRRRASRVFGRNEGSGLRCVSHGWRRGVLGNLTEMVFRPAQHQRCEKLKHKADSTKEWGDFVWTYRGFQGEVAEFMSLAWEPAADTRVRIAKELIPCNRARF